MIERLGKLNAHTLLPYRLIFATIVTGIVGAFGCSADAFEPGASATVRSFYDALLTVMRNGQTLGVRGRYSQLEPAVSRTFDIPFMTRLAIGPDWSGLSELERQRVTDAFRRYVVAVYADRFQSYKGQQMDVLGERPFSNGILVSSRIVKADGNPVTINYLVKQNGSAWQVTDVFFEGTISEMATRRSEFASVLRTSGIQGLIQVLNRKADDLGGS